MSENLRLGLNVGIFSLIGSGIFMMFSGVDDKQRADKATTSNKANTSEDLPIGNYALLGNPEGYTSTEDPSVRKTSLEREADFIMYPMANIYGVVKLPDMHYLFEEIPAGKVTLNAYGTSLQKRKASTGEVLLPETFNETTLTEFKYEYSLFRLHWA